MKKETGDLKKLRTEFEEFKGKMQEFKNQTDANFKIILSRLNDSNKIFSDLSYISFFAEKESLFETKLPLKNILESISSSSFCYSKIPNSEESSINSDFIKGNDLNEIREKLKKIKEKIKVLERSDTSAFKNVEQLTEEILENKPFVDNLRKSRTDLHKFVSFDKYYHIIENEIEVLKNYKKESCFLLSKNKIEDFKNSVKDSTILLLLKLKNEQKIYCGLTENNWLFDAFNGKIERQDKSNTCFNILNDKIINEMKCCTQFIQKEDDKYKKFGFKELFIISTEKTSKYNKNEFYIDEIEELEAYKFHY